MADAQSEPAVAAAIEHGRERLGMKQSRLFPWLLALLVQGRVAVSSLGPLGRLSLTVSAGADICCIHGSIEVPTDQVLDFDLVA